MRVNLNRYQQGRLPNFSYLYLFQNFSKQGPNTRLDLYQELTYANLWYGVKRTCFWTQWRKSISSWTILLASN